ncbi:MAG: hypothetical protein ILP12_02475 [Lachnospiraceae bacterium]|nr:hypothetical protein [Lachnospiraceae bacterium]
MIRTNVVTLTVIPAVAYRRKLASGGSGIVILREGSAQPGIAAISKTSGKAIPAPNTPADFPEEAFAEAIKLTAGLPYRKQGGFTYSGEGSQEIQEPEMQETETLADSDEYKKLVEAYTDQKGRLSYDLLNRDLIKFAHSSSKVRAMVENGTKTADIRRYVVSTKFRNVTGKKDLSEEEIQKMADLLDEVSPKSVFKELNAGLKRMKSRK